LISARSSALAAVDIADFKGAARLPELVSISPLLKTLSLAQPTQRLAVRKICNRSGRLALNHILVLALLIFAFVDHTRRDLHVDRRPEKFSATVSGTARSS